MAVLCQCSVDRVCSSRLVSGYHVPAPDKVIVDDGICNPIALLRAALCTISLSHMLCWPVSAMRPSCSITVFSSSGGSRCLQVARVCGGEVVSEVSCRSGFSELNSRRCSPYICGIEFLRRSNFISQWICLCEEV